MRLALSSECDSLTHGGLCLLRPHEARKACYYFVRVIAGGSSSLPLYEYKCEKCGHQFEKIEGHTASETKKCPKCGAKARRMLSKAAIQFKGSGWYVTDYGKKNSSPASGEKSGDGGSSKSEEKSAESKPNDSKSSESKSSESKPSDSKSSESKSTDSKSSSEKGTKRKK
jgi:putative FmdB family regulatory protein